MLISFSLIYFLLLGYLTYLSVFKLDSKRRLIVKIIEAALFIVMFFAFSKVTYTSNQRLYICYLGALISSFLGDLMLGLFNYYDKLDQKYFIFGTLLFFLAQIFYIGYFAFANGFIFNVLYISLPFISYITLIIVLEKIKVSKKIILISSTYSLGVSGMFTAGLVYSLTTNTILIPFAAFMFLISDFTLAIKYFYKGKKVSITILTTVSYFLAQYLYILYLV